MHKQLHDIALGLRKYFDDQLSALSGDANFLSKQENLRKEIPLFDELVSEVTRETVDQRAVIKEFESGAADIRNRIDELVKQNDADKAKP